jgi:hypothetical protein
MTQMGQILSNVAWPGRGGKAPKAAICARGIELAESEVNQRPRNPLLERAALASIWRHPYRQIADQSAAKHFALARACERN